MTFFKPTKPSKRAGTDNWQFTRRLPKPLHARLSGHFLKVVLPAYKQAEALPVDEELKPILSFSLKTSDEVVAYDRCNRCDNVLMQLLEVLRSGTHILSDDEIEAHAQSVFMFYKETFIDSVGLPSESKTLESIVQVEDLYKMGAAGIWNKDRRSLQYWQIWEYTYFVGYKSNDVSSQAIDFRVGNLVNWWMYRNQLRLSFENRQRLLVKVDQIARYAELSGRNDYTRQVSSPQEELKPKRCVSFDKIVDAWKADEQDRYETIRKREYAIANLKAFIKDDNANAITEQQFIDWRNFIKPPRYAPNTVNRILIAGVKAVFSHAFSNKSIDNDYTSVIRRVKHRKRPDEVHPYTDKEVQTLVNAARKESDPVIKFFVLLLAATGSRYAEIAQLGADQIHQEDGNFNWLEIRDSSFGGELKTTEAERNVPLTDVLIRQEFFDFVKSREGKPLFYTPNNKIRKGKQYDNVRLKTGLWINKFPKSDPETDTHHGFRHWIYTRGNDVKIRREIVNDFVGHAREGAQGGYGKRNNIQVLSEEMEKIWDLFKD